MPRDLASALVVLCLLAAGASACDKADDPSSSQLPPGSITGRERLGWNQRAPDAEELAQYSYVLYVDNAPTPLPAATCGPLVGEIPAASCSSPLPPLKPGTHTLELGTRVSRGTTTLESERSSPLVVTVVGAGTAGAVSQSAQAAGRGLSQPEPYAVEPIVRGLDRPSALARLPDGRLLVAEHGGRIRTVEAGLLLDDPAVALSGARTEDGQRVSLAVAPDFASSRLVYVAYAVGDEDEPRVGRVVRFREAGGRLGEPAVIIDGLPAEAGAPRLRAGPDGTLYVAVNAADPGHANDLGSYSGKILRFTPGGSTPADNPVRASPVFSSGHRGRIDFDWEPERGRLWHVESDERGVSMGPSDPGRRGPGVLRLDGVHASDVAFHSGAEPPAWSGSLFLAVPDQECLYRVTGLSLKPPGPGFEQVLAGRFGRVSAVLSADDGLYFATGNGGKDASGRPADVVYRVRGKAPGG